MRILFLLLLPIICHAEVLVIFGATGDLTKRKLVPALIELQSRHLLPEDFQVIGVGKREEREFLNGIAPFITDEKGWELLKSKLTYLKDYREIAKFKGEKLFYLATPPSQFIPILKELHDAKLLDESAKVLIEKPLGRDFDSGLHLKNELTALLNPKQIFLIDHYLGKEMVQNIPKPELGTKIDHVTITLSEEIGIESRGAFWEETGYLRDMIQSHAMQLLMLTAMENGDKASLLKSVLPIPPEAAVRGQYSGYRQEKNVAQGSNVETFAAVKLFIDNERWRGCPFILKGGKRLAEKYTEIKFTFKSKETLIYRILPAPMDGYSSILLAAIRNDDSYFTTFEEHLLSWALFTPILNHWSANPPHDFPNYAPGSEGPTTFGE